ncbi:MAG: gene transfer agent family protein [Allorhizobium sp.]
MGETTFRAFFGDGEHDFTLTPWAIGELERITGTGIGTLIQRIPEYRFHHAELTETLRLALIGAGMSPEAAAQKVAVYATPRPIAEVLPLVLGTLQRAWAGAGDPVEDAAHG